MLSPCAKQPANFILGFIINSSHRYPQVWLYNLSCVEFITRHVFQCLKIEDENFLFRFCDLEMWLHGII